MARSFGRRRPQVTGLERERGEKVLAVSPVTGGSQDATRLGLAVATTSALVLLAGGEQKWRRRWHELDHGTWDGDNRTLGLGGVDGWQAVLHLGEDARLDLAVAVHDRLQASVVATRHAQVGDGPSVRVSVRQVQGGPEDGRLLVQELLPSVAPMGTQLRAAVLACRQELEESVGLPPSGAAGRRPGDPEGTT